MNHPAPTGHPAPQTDDDAPDQPDPSGEPDSVPSYERKALAKLERVIARAMTSWVPEARALRAVRDARLYRATHPSFELYVEDRWGIKRRRAYQLVKAAPVADAIRTAGLPAPLSETHVRPLTRFSVGDALGLRGDVVRAAGGADRVTRGLAEAVVREVVGGRAEEAGASGGKPVLSDEAQAQIAAAEATAGHPVTCAPPPLVSVPPSLYTGGAADGAPGAPGPDGPVLVPSAVARRLTGVDPLSGAGLAEVARLFEAYYEAAGKRGPVMNVTNDHVGWALHTLNVVTGCTWTCPFCYAREIAGLRYPQGFVPTVRPERLLAPANTTVPRRHLDDPGCRRVFLGSQADWMDPCFPDAVVRATLDACRAHPEWEFLTLTKQPQRLADSEYPPNVWVGVTVTRQGQVAPMEAALSRVEAPVRWVSFEPLHGPVELSRPELVDLYVIGAERKTAQRPRVKPTEAGWVDGLRMQARSVGAAVWEKENLDARLREMPTPRRTSDGIPPAPNEPPHPSHAVGERGAIRSVSRPRRSVSYPRSGLAEIR